MRPAAWTEAFKKLENDPEIYWKKWTHLKKDVIYSKLFDYAIRNRPSLLTRDFGTIPNRSLSLDQLAVFLEATIMDKIEYLHKGHSIPPALFAKCGTSPDDAFTNRQCESI